MISEAVILAGGFGTRIRDELPDVTKPMAVINSIPLLSYIFDKQLALFAYT